MKIILLTHEREVTRPTNTGHIAVNHAGEHCQRIVWSRVKPDPALLKALSLPDTVLLFPENTADELNDTADRSASQAEQINREPSVQQYIEVTNLPQTVVILDATWQEARKMLRQSAYLKTARRYSLTETAKSEFTLRRNQVEGGLCTVECIIELFKQAGMNDEAQRLHTEFVQFCHLPNS